MINSISLKNFKLFKNQEITFDKINVITGDNYSGKSTLLKGIIFGYYGEASGTNLQRLISFGEKETQVDLYDNEFHIIRKVPLDLQVFHYDKEIQKNTPTLKQQYIDEQIGNYEFFKKFRLISKQSTNLLDYAKDSRSIVTLRKELMSFINADFSTVRQSLLNQKLERENKNVNKRLYKFYLSPKRLTTLENGLNELMKVLQESSSQVNEQRKIVNKLESEIQTKERLIYNRNKEFEEAQKSGICPILKTKCSQITKQITPEQKDKINLEIANWQSEIKKLKENLEVEQDYLNDLELGLQNWNEKIQNTKSYIMKLKEAFKFSEYKYTIKDVELYTSAIKVIDDFSGWYIQRWLDNLAIVINDLLKDINLKVIFSADKQFLTIIENERELDYNDLSSGQQIFLSVIFKLAILLHNGITNGIVIIDEGINELKLNNLHKLIEILKNLPFQIFLIYQNISEDISEVNYIKVERRNNESKTNAN